MLKHFKLSEFQCPCCKVISEMDTTVLQKIDSIRERLGVPLHVNSAYRCAKHNEDVGGKISSLHLKGKALDISTANLVPEKKRKFLELSMSEFSGIGIAKTYIHLDIGTPKMWVY